MKVQKSHEKFLINEIEDVNELENLKAPVSFYIEIDKTNYHLGQILGMSVYDGNTVYYIKKIL